MSENTTEKSIKQRLVYDFFYPGILGSILYDILPFENNVLFYIKLVIVFFLSLDYFHLYFILDSKFKQQEKDTWGYVFFDFIVAVLIFVAFKYSMKDPYAVIWSIAFIPACFLVYSIILKYNRIFYLAFSILSLISAYLLSYKLKIEPAKINYYVLGLSSLITLTYLIYVVKTALPKKTATNKKIA